MFALGDVWISKDVLEPALHAELGRPWGCDTKIVGAPARHISYLGRLRKLLPHIYG